MANETTKLDVFANHWWTLELSALWKEFCKCEKVRLNCKSRGEKQRLKTEYVNKRKVFDRCVQRRKRQFWIESREKL